MKTTFIHLNLMKSQNVVILPVIILLFYITPSATLPVFNKPKFDYDLIIIGAGASGMFSAGTASGFGKKTLLIEKLPSQSDNDNSGVISDKSYFVGGDCSNAACVPSKAIRSVAKIASAHHDVKDLKRRMDENRQTYKKSLSNSRRNSQKGSEKDSHDEIDFYKMARTHSRRVVSQVRERESVERLSQNPYLDLAFVEDTSFVKPHEIILSNPQLFNTTLTSSDIVNGKVLVRAKKFIIATGATPSIPQSIQNSEMLSGVKVLTYKSLFRPDGEGLISDNYLWSIISSKTKKNKIVIAGGGPTACEISQSLARLNPHVNITMVAPTILPSEDVAARCVARKILRKDGVEIIHGHRVVSVARFGQIPTAVIDDNTRVPADILIVCCGREPESNLSCLKLENAGIKFSRQGVEVDKNLRSISAKHVFAVGDCASVIKGGDRRASHAAWTGYHAVQSAFLPRFLLPSDSIHPFVPRVTFMDPEITSVGLTRKECIRKFGENGFHYLKVDEAGTDRADADALERSTLGFVELRVSIPHGHVLGATVCSPAAAEIINELGLAMSNKLTVRDIARSLHAYPSHGYLMYRAALSLAVNDIWGALAACGSVGKIISAVGRTISYRLSNKRRKNKISDELKEWQSEGCEQEIDYQTIVDGSLITTPGISFLEASKDETFCNLARRYALKNGRRSKTSKTILDFLRWLKRKPS